MEIKVIKSFRRRRTASARLKDGILQIRLPAFLPTAEVEKTINQFKKLFAKKQRKVIPSDKELAFRADKLNQKYFEGKLKYDSICWSNHQNSLHGSCSTRRKTIRISSKLARAPKWVLDAIIVHELTHLLVPNHSSKFWQLANRYPLMERARGYLMAIDRKNYSGV